MLTVYIHASSKYRTGIKFLLKGGGHDIKKNN